MPGITPLPTPPSRSDPTNFATRADAFLAALATFVTEANALAVAMGVPGPPFVTETVTVTTLLNLSGGQAQFPATQIPAADANTLDDFEKGTFTPAIGANVTGPTVGYTTRAASYVKIGPLVYIQGYVQTSSVSGGSGVAALTGLPFTAVNIAGIVSGVSVTQYGGFNLSAGYTQLTLNIDPNTSFALFYENGDNVNAQGVAIGACGATTFIGFSGTYRATQ